MAGSHATRWPMLLALPYYLRVSKNTFLFLSGSTMLNDIHKLAHSPTFLNCLWQFFSHFYNDFYFRNTQEDNVRKVVKKLIKVIKL